MTMGKLRSTFWTKAEKFIDWCTDEELRVLSQKAGKEIERRLTNNEHKYNLEGVNKKQKGNVKYG